jgi:transcription elongation factor GreA
MADDRIPMTREGYEKLKTELSHLNDVKMIEVTKRVAAARDLGDLSENAEYHAAREDQGLLQARPTSSTPSNSPRTRSSSARR